MLMNNQLDPNLKWCYNSKDPVEPTSRWPGFCELLNFALM